MREIIAYECIKVIYDGKLAAKPKTTTELWKALKWDVGADKQAKACADIVVRQLVSCNEIDLSCLCKGHTLQLIAVPVAD